MIPKPIALIGFMGCGKTTIGKKLAEILAQPFYDLDEEIEKAEARTIKDIFNSNGEEYFRKLEVVALANHRYDTSAVVSCGGGIITHTSACEYLLGSYITIWIDVPVEELLIRLRSEWTSRPLLSGVSFEATASQLYEKRYLLYKKNSHYRCAWDKDSTVESLATEIANYCYAWSEG